jgi:hypothetical protein
VQLINKVVDDMRIWKKDYPDEYYKLSFYQDNALLYQELKIRIDKLIQEGSKPEEIPSPIIIGKQTEMDATLKTCIDNLAKGKLIGIDFSKEDYSALYLIIYDRYKNHFKKNTTFVMIKKYFDSYFGVDSGTFRPNKLKDNCMRLKHDYQWIEKEI